jgi:hypothetical protein
MKVVVPLVTDADVVVSEPHPPERDKLSVMAKERNLTGAITRLLNAIAGNSPGA